MLTGLKEILAIADLGNYAVSAFNENLKRHIKECGTPQIRTIERITIFFEGISMKSTVYLNGGTRAAEFIGMYG